MDTTGWKVMNDHFNKNSDMKFPLVVFMNSSEVKSNTYSTRKYHKRHDYVRYARTWYSSVKVFTAVSSWNYDLTLTAL